MSIAEDCFQYEQDVVGYDIAKFFNVSSAFDCQRTCQIVDSCQFFTLDPIRGDCWLKHFPKEVTIVPQNSSYEGAVFGPKYC